MGKIPLFFIAFFILIILFLSGCFQQANSQQTQSKTAEQYCIDLCISEKANGADFSNGPCLANPLLQTQDTVCDIAHNPRLPVDEQQENQCSAFRLGRAQHFIELNEQCSLIKKY